jgi:hypothetical protein
MIDIAIADAAERPVRPDDVEDALDFLQIHRQALEAVSYLAGDRPALQPTKLLEVGELGNLHAVEPDLPAKAPGAEAG